MKYYLLYIVIGLTLWGCRKKVVTEVVKNKLDNLRESRWNIIEDLRLDVESGFNDSVFLLTYYPQCQIDDQYLFGDDDSLYVLENGDICTGNPLVYTKSYYRLDSSDSPWKLYISDEDYWNVEILNQDTLKLKKTERVSSWADSSIFYQTYTHD